MEVYQVPFRGAANIYLQGKGALLNDGFRNGSMNYYLGTQTSKIKITDARLEPVNTARLVLNGDNRFVFSDKFNQPAWVEIREDGTNVEIEMQDCAEEGDLPTLWMGVLNDNRMAAHKIEWEVLKMLGPCEFVFAALIPPGDHSDS